MKLENTTQTRGKQVSWGAVTLVIKLENMGLKELTYTALHKAHI